VTERVVDVFHRVLQFQNQRKLHCFFAVIHSPLAEPVNDHWVYNVQDP
jgi:hypothetical protein